MKAKALVEIQEEWPDHPDTYSAVIRCSECDFASFTSVRTALVSAQEYATNSIRYHLETHNPGRAPDIDVEYKIEACCSVCEDGIGDVTEADSETLECNRCGSHWSIDGTYGYTKEDDG